MEKYEFRRQFIGGTKFFGDKKFWKHVEISDNLKLSVHQDLPLTMLDKGARRIALLGYMIDPFYPDSDDSDIVEWLLKNSLSFSKLIENTYRLCGRWALIYAVDKKVFFLSDPFAMRQIYFGNIGGEFWCGSNPAILSNYLNLEPDKTDANLNEFIRSEAFKKKECYWIGDKTRYKEIRHLLPNHYLDAGTAKAERFWINHEQKYSVNDAANRAGQLLQNSLHSANRRFKLMMPVTAGWDSRVLLSASKEITDDLFYFISTKNFLTEEDDDVKIPQKLFNHLGIKFHVLDHLKEPDSEFLQLLNKNVDMPRSLQKTLTFYEYYLHHQDKVNVNGRGAETARGYYPYDKNPTAEFLANVTGYPESDFVLSEIKNWLGKARPFVKDKKIDLIDFYYWEQRMGNWGGTDPAEQDLAIEEFCPFNNRKLMMILLGTKRKYRSEPDYILSKKIISFLWNEVLEEPINPISNREFLLKLIKRKIPYFLKNQIKRKLRKYPYN